MSPRKKHASSFTNGAPPPESGLPTSSSASDAATDSEDPFEVIVPVNDTSYFEGRSISQDTTDVFLRHAVPPETKARYPGNPESDGWKIKKFYVIRRGLEIGIYFDFWYVIPECKLSFYSHKLVGVIFCL
jgi:hypothetical protein